MAQQWPWEHLSGALYVNNGNDFVLKLRPATHLKSQKTIRYISLNTITLLNNDKASIVRLKITINLRYIM